jgi:hypothetical protein
MSFLLADYGPERPGSQVGGTPAPVRACGSRPACVGIGHPSKAEPRARSSLPGRALFRPCGRALQVVTHTDRRKVRHLGYRGHVIVVFDRFRHPRTRPFLSSRGSALFVILGRDPRIGRRAPFQGCDLRNVGTDPRGEAEDDVGEAPLRRVALTPGQYSVGQWTLYCGQPGREPKSHGLPDHVRRDPGCDKVLGVGRHDGALPGLRGATVARG